MKTYFLTGDCNWQGYGGKWITKKLNNGDFDYWIVIEFINMYKATGDKTVDKYVAQITAVSPKAAGWKNIKDALRCCCLKLKDFKPEQREKIIIEALSDYGLSAPLDSFSGNNYKNVMKKARQSLDVIAGMFGFFMDGSKNCLGHNGWNFISGDLSLDNLPDHYTPNMHVL